MRTKPTETFIWKMPDKTGCHNILSDIAFFLNGRWSAAIFKGFHYAVMARIFNMLNFNV